MTLRAQAVYENDGMIAGGDILLTGGGTGTGIHATLH